MIKILDGKLTVPEDQRFIGFAGDNMIRKIQFLVLNRTNPTDIYRLYLTFDNGSVNHFQLPATVSSEGTILTWDVEEEHIFKSGIVYARIKGFSRDGVVFHTNKDLFVVGPSAEYSEYFEKDNTEFLEYEKKLNALREYIEEVSLHAPYIGENGNWFVFDSKEGSYVDTGKPSVGKALTADIEDGAVTSDKIAAGAVTAPKLGQYSVTTDAIVPSAVTEDKLASQSVTTEKIADESVTGVKIQKGVVGIDHLAENIRISSEMLDDTYWKVKEYIPAISYADLDSVFDDEDFTNTLYKFKFSGLSSVAAVLGNDDYIAVASSESDSLTLFNTENGEIWFYVRDSGTLTKKETAESCEKDFINAGYFSNLDSIKSYSFENSKTYRFYISSSVGVIPYGQYMGSVVKIDAGEPETLEFCNLIPDGKGYVLNLENGELIIKDMTEGMKTTLGDIDMLLKRI